MWTMVFTHACGDNGRVEHIKEGLNHLQYVFLTWIRNIYFKSDLYKVVCSLNHRLLADIDFLFSAAHFPLFHFPNPDHSLPLFHHHPSPLSTLSGDLRLRLAGVGDEVHRSADVGAADVPHASEHDSALRQTQPQDQHLPLWPQKPQGSAARGEFVRWLYSKQYSNFQKIQNDTGFMFKRSLSVILKVTLQ